MTQSRGTAQLRMPTYEPMGSSNLSHDSEEQGSIVDFETLSITTGTCIRHAEKFHSPAPSKECRRIMDYCCTFEWQKG